MTYVALTLCYKLRSFLYIDFNILAVAWTLCEPHLLSLHAKIWTIVFHECIILNKRSLVTEKVHSFPCSQFSLQHTHTCSAEQYTLLLQFNFMCSSSLFRISDLSATLSCYISYKQHHKYNSKIEPKRDWTRNLAITSWSHYDTSYQCFERDIYCSHCYHV